MLAIYASTALITAASLLIGHAILGLLGWQRPAWLSGATGFGVLVVLSPFLVRLPGRATTAAILLGLLVIASAAIVLRDRRPAEVAEWPAGLAAALIVVALGSLPFLFNDRVGVLGEGIYTNDHAGPTGSSTASGPSRARSASATRSALRRSRRSPPRSPEPR
jgi:hypothetical protein